MNKTARYIIFFIASALCIALVVILLRYVQQGENTCDFTMILAVIFVLITYILMLFLLFYSNKMDKSPEFKSKFVNCVAHELKTPIATISLATEGLLDNDIIKDKELIDNYIRIIQTENKRLENMVSTILESAFVSRKFFTLRQKKNPVNINYCIDSAINTISIHLKERNGTINVIYSQKNAIVCVDSNQITQVIKNILENAIKYVSNTIYPQIEIKTENIKKHIVISIKDNGIGMTQAQQKKIFKKFYRVQSEHIQPVKGYGLGLYNAKAIIKAHQGKITIESEPDKGSTFKIYLPAKEL